MRSAITCCKKLFPFILLLLLLAGCGKKLPDPQVIHLQDTPVIFPVPTAAASPVSSPTAAAPTETAVSTDAPFTIRYEVPILSQEGLTLNGAPTGVGCVPACIEMITTWYNSVSEDYPILGAQEVIDRNAEQGLYEAGRGMTSASAADELAELGYAHRMKMNSSKEELLADLEAYGPVGVLVKTNWVPTTMNHAAVLTAYDEATDTVTLNDPFYGSAVSWSWDAFDGIWGLNYAGDRDYSGEVVRRIFFEIYPKNR